MAASEGQIECLRILLELKADTRVVDNRNQTPLDLARLWGHRTCAKLLGASIWQKDKDDITQQHSLVRKLRTQDILKEIEQAHFAQFETKEDAENKFDIWLTNQGFPSSSKSVDTKKSKKLPDLDLRADSSKTSRTTGGGLTSTMSKEQLDVIGSGDTATPFSIPMSRLPSTSITTDRDGYSPKKYPKFGKKLGANSKSPKSPENPWNYSTKAKGKEYITNLNDFFPRDHYTKMPENLDLMLLNTELKGMSMEQVKEFMRKKLENNPNAFKHIRTGSPGIMDPADERPVYYAPKNIVDTQTKVRLPEDTPAMDIAAFSFGNDINSFAFREAKRFVDNSQAKQKAKKAGLSSHGSYYNTEDTLSQIKGLLSTNTTTTGNNITNSKGQFKDEKLEIVRKNYGKDLADFMTDKRHGKMSQKYEKVFIY